MKNNIHLIILTTVIYLAACSEPEPVDKGFPISPETRNTGRDDDKTVGFHNDSLQLKTRPSDVLLTVYKNLRISPVYKINLKDDGSIFIGKNNFYSTHHRDDSATGNIWNNNFMPGFEAVYGFNMVNAALYDVAGKSSRDFFESPVLVKTLYYPAFSRDTLNFEPVSRNYFMISAYDEDTNNDGYINQKDLRRFYYFDSTARNKTLLIPAEYSVQSSVYDSANDYMYVFAKHDSDKDGASGPKEPVHIFWLDLKSPLENGKLY
jgi:hypothetical protein